jgi:hypothetical protein
MEEGAKKDWYTGAEFIGQFTNYRTLEPLIRKRSFEEGHQGC